MTTITIRQSSSIQSVAYSWIASYPGLQIEGPGPGYAIEGLGTRLIAGQLLLTAWYKLWPAVPDVV